MYGYKILFIVLNMPFMPKTFALYESQGQECVSPVSSRCSIKRTVIEDCCSSVLGSYFIVNTQYSMATTRPETANVNAFRKGCQQWHENILLAAGESPKQQRLVEKARPPISSGLSYFLHKNKGSVQRV